MRALLRTRKQLVREKAGHIRLQLRGGTRDRGRRFNRSPEMLSVVRIVNNTRGWYEAGAIVQQRIASEKARG